MSAAVPFKTLPYAGFVFFEVDCTIYTARKKLTPADLGLGAEDLPPATLASLGSMSSSDPKALSKFESYRGAMRNVCLGAGIRHRGRYAVPEAKAIEVSRKLDEIVTEFYRLKATFLQSFEANREAWLNKPEFAQWTDKIRARLDTVRHVDRQLQADYEAYTMGSLDELPKVEAAEESPLASGVLRAFDSMEATAFDELGAMAKSIVENSVLDENGHPRAEVTQKILSPIRKILEKADGLAFALPRLAHLISFSKSVLGQLPPKGKMSGAERDLVFMLIQSLTDPESVIRNAEAAQASVNAEIDEDEMKAVQAIGLANIGPIDQQGPQSDLDFEVDEEAPTVQTAGVAQMVESDGDVVYDEI